MTPMYFYFLRYKFNIVITILVSQGFIEDLPFICWNWVVKGGSTICQPHDLRNSFPLSVPHSSVLPCHPWVNHQRTFLRELVRRLNELIRVLQVVLCPPNKMCCSPDPKHLRMWPYLEIGSLQV